MDSGKNIKTARATYESFIKASTMGAIACAIIAAFVVFLISR